MKVFIDGLPAWKKAGHLIASSLPGLKAMIDKGVPHVLVDIRPTDMAGGQFIKGAASVPVDELATAQAKFPSDKKAPIIVYCNHTMRSPESAGIIRKWGYTNVSYLEGGIEGWKKAGNTVESGTPVASISYTAKPMPGEIFPADFTKLVGAPAPDQLILDVRDTEEAAEGMFKAAMNIPTQDVASRLADIPKDKEIITHCSTGARAEIAYNVLKEKGYKARYLNATVKIGKDGKYEITKE